MSSNTFFESGHPFGYLGVEQQNRRANRRRLAVFLSVFLLAALAGLVFVFSRPAIYEATLRLNFVPVAGQPGGDPARASDKRFSLRDEVQFLTSRTLLAQAWERLKQSSAPPPATLSAADPAASLQSMLSAAALEGSNIVLLRAQGGEPAFLSALLDQLVAAYQAGLADRYKSASTGMLAEAGDEARKLDASVIAKRREADAFRARHNIVSLERDENQVLSEVRGIGVALNAANDKVISSESRLGALQEAQTAGKSAARSKDNPTLAVLEQQAATIRADINGLGENFTPQFLDLDPRIRTQRARLAELERDIASQRQSGAQDALQEARDDAAGARAAATRLRQQLAANQGSVHAFTSRFNEYQALQQELAKLQELRQKAVERVVALGAQEKTRMPKVEVVEAAATPHEPVSPWYARDAALALAGALIAALLTMGIVELFNRPPRLPATVVIPQAWMPVAGGGGGYALDALDMPRHRALPDAAHPSALPAPRPLPRELAAHEISALLGAAEQAPRAASALLLMGLTEREVLDLRGGDIDRDAALLRVTGAAERQIPLPANILALLTEGDKHADASLIASHNRLAMTEADLGAALLYAAHDAGIDNAGEVTPLSLRHTYVAFLLRQGMRFSDLVKLVGHLPADTLAAYRLLAPVGPRQSAEAIDRLLPALRELPIG